MLAYCFSSDLERDIKRFQNFEFDRGVSLKLSSEAPVNLFGQTFGGQISKVQSRVDLASVEETYLSPSMSSNHFKDQPVGNPFKATLDLETPPKISNINMLASQNLEPEFHNSGMTEKSTKPATKLGLITQSVPKAAMISQISHMQVSSLEGMDAADQEQHSPGVAGQESAFYKSGKTAEVAVGGRRDQDYTSFGGRITTGGVPGPVAADESHLRIVSGLGSSVQKQSEVSAPGRRYTAAIGDEEGTQGASQFSRNYQSGPRRVQESRSDWNQSAQQPRNQERKALLAGQDASQTVVAESNVSQSRDTRSNYKPSYHPQSGYEGSHHREDDIEGMSHAESRNFSVSTPYSVRDRPTTTQSKAPYNYENFRASRIVEPALGRYSQLAGKEMMTANASSTTNALFVGLF